VLMLGKIKCSTWPRVATGASPMTDEATDDPVNHGQETTWTPTLTTSRL